MSLAAIRDAIDLLTTRPALWIPGIACGLLAALVWIVTYIGGVFFAGRLLIFVLLAMIFFVTVSLMAIRDNGKGAKDLLRESGAYYFRVLTPTLVIISGIVLVFALVILTLALFGIQPYAGLVTFLIFGVLLPTLMLTFFYDTAAVFEDKKVFESLQRSIEVVTANLFEVMLFYIGCFVISCTVAFVFFVAWTAALADRLEPLTHYNETQIAALTADQFTGLIGQGGFWVTAACIFGVITLLFPLLFTYKACFFRIISGRTIPIEQTIGEYDSKGRWYKY
jgi:hypothetical protein